MCTIYYANALAAFTRGMGEAKANFTIQMMGNESLIPRARNNVLAEFLKTECSHLFFIDADISFTPQHVIDMCACGLDLVCGAYPKKCIRWDHIEQEVKAGSVSLAPELEMAGTDWATNFFEQHKAVDKFPVLESPDGRGGTNYYVECKESSTGFMCISRECVERMVKAYSPSRQYMADTNGAHGEPRWDLFYSGIDPADSDPKTRRYLSEDYGFCRLWQAIGGKVWMYTGAVLSHTGTYTFRGDFSRLFKFKPQGETGPAPDARPEDEAAARAARRKAQAQAAAQGAEPSGRA
jgi:hypothetical protein